MPNQTNQSPIDLRTAAQIWNDNLGLRDQLSGKQTQDAAANNIEISWTDPLKAAGGSALTSLGGGIKNLSLGDLVRAVRNVPETAGNLASSVAEQANDELAGNPFMQNMGLKPQDVQRVYTKDNPIEKAGNAIAESVPVQVLGDAMHNVGEAVQRGADIADKVVKPVSRTVGDAIDSAGDSIHDRISPDGQKALQSQMVSEDSEGFHPGDAWGDPGKLAMKFSDAIGSIGGVVGSSMLTGGTVRQMVTRTMLRRGASEAVAKDIADKTARHWAANAAMATGITMSTGQSAEQVQDAYATVSDEDKLNSPIFKDTVRSVYQQHPDWTAQQRMELVDQQMKDKLASAALSDPKTYAAAAAGTMLGDAMLAKMVTGGGTAFTGSLVTRMGKGILKGAAGESVGEGTEQAIQQNVQNNVMNEVSGTDIDPMQDVARGGLEAGILGGLTGGAMGSAGGIHKAPAGQTDPVTETSGEIGGQPVQPKPDDQIPDIADAIREVSANPVPGSFSIGKDGDSYRGIFVNPDGKSAFTKPYSSPQQVKDALHPYLANSQNSAEAQSRDVQLDEPAYLRTGNIPEELQQPTAEQPVDDVRRSEPEGMLQPLQPVVTGNPDEPAFLRTRSLNPTGRDLSGQPDASPYSDVQQRLARQQSAPTPDELIRNSVANGDQGKTPQEDFVVGDYLPGQTPAQPQAEQPGVTVDGDVREVIPESNQLTHNGVINMTGQAGDGINSEYVPPVTANRVTADQSLGQETIRDPRTPVGQSIQNAGQQHDAIFDQLKSLRVTRKGKPFRTEKEALLASRPTETPVALPEGGFGVADKSEVAQIKSGQPLTESASNQVAKTEMADLSSENMSDQRRDDNYDQADTNAVNINKNIELDNRGEVGNLSSDTSETSPSFPKNSQVQIVRKVAKPVTPREAEHAAKSWLKNFKTNLKVVAVTNQEELSRVLATNGYDGTIAPGTIVGASFMPRTDTLVLNTETIGSVKDVQRLMRHEAMVHYGLTHFAGPDTFSQVFNAIMEGYVTSPEIKATFDHVMKSYGNTNLLIKMEEVFAHYAERRPMDGGPVARLWQRVKDIVRQALIRTGFIKPNAAEEELDGVLRDIAANMRAGRQDDEIETGPDGSGDSRHTDEKFKQGDDIESVLDSAFTKLGLKPKPGLVEKTRTNLGKLKETNRHQFWEWVKQQARKANTEVLDELAPIKYAEDATGKQIDASESGYIAARMSKGSSTVMNATMLYGLPEWHDGVIRRKPGTGENDAMLGIFSGLGKDLNHWLMWMAGHRAENLMAEGRENLFTPDEIEVMKGLNHGKEKQFEDARQQWKALNKAVLDLAQEAGLIEPGIRDQWESEWYVPFYRDNDDGDVTAPYRKRGIANQSSGIRKLKGGTANVHDLLENIFNSTSRLIDASMKNMATLRTIHNLADTDLITINDKPNLMDFRSLKNPKSRMFSVKMDGKDVLVTVHDPELFNAMTMISHVSQPNTFVRMGMFAKHLLTAGITIDPGFMFRNFIRDAASAWTMNKDGFRPVIDSARGVLKSWKMDPTAIDMMFAGATFQGGNLRGNDPGVMAASVRKALRAKGLSPEQIDEYQNSLITSAKAAKAKLGHYLEQYEKMGESVENGSRVAIYEAALKAGKSKAQAAFEARDLMDFSMGGASGTVKFLINVLPFFNARLQGLGKLGRAFQDHPKQIARRGGMIAAASLALLAVNWDDKRYNQLPDWDKDNNWHFWVGDQHFRIPKPFELGLLFGTLPERMIRTAGGVDTTGKLGREIGSNIWSTIEINPIPQVVRPLMEAYLMNTNTFTWSPIETMSDQNMEPRARYNEQTSLTMRGIGESLNMSPKKLEYIWRGYTGTVGAYVMALSDAIIRHTGDYGETPSVRADQIPILNSIYQGSAPARNTQDMQDFYDLLDDALKARQTFRNYLKDGERDKAREMLGDPEEKANIQKSTAINQVQQSFRTMRNQIEMIRRDRQLDGDQKTERINRILAQRNDFAGKLVKRFGTPD